MTHFSRRFCRPVHASRRGFTLAEMLVALSVLIVALAVVTQIFGVTTKTAQTSSALSEAQSWLEPFIINLQKDLEGIDPARSVLAITGRTQAAALTEDLRAGGNGRFFRVLTGDPQAVPTGFNPETTVPMPANSQYSDPRADLMMFFTNRGMVSRAPATTNAYATLGPGLTPLQQFERALQSGSLVSPVQIMYGHLSFADVTVDGTNITWPDLNNLKYIDNTNSPGQLSPLPATEWILGRRATAIFDNSSTLFGSNVIPSVRGFRILGNGSGNDYANDALVRFTRCYAGAGEGGNPSNYAGDALEFPLSAMFRYLSGAEFGGNTSPGPRLSPYDFTRNLGNFPPWNPPPFVLPNGRWTNNERQVIFSLMYPRYPRSNGGGIPDDNHFHFATLARNAPKQLESNQSMKALPGCVWFQVEFLMPEDPRNSVFHPLTDQRNDMPRWCQVPPGQTYVFVPDTQENRQTVLSEVITNPALPADNGRPVSGSRLESFAQVIPPFTANVGSPPMNGLDKADNRRVRMWPYAIRITVRAHDPKGRLNDPIVRTIVHRFDE